MKTKKQLLAVLERMNACFGALEWARNRRAESADKIGLECDRPEWLVWFLWRRLTPPGRRLFAKRLGLRRSVDFGGVGYRGSDIAFGTRPFVAYDHDRAMKLDRRVINDCWRAWCRSKP